MREPTTDELRTARKSKKTTKLLKKVMKMTQKVEKLKDKLVPIVPDDYMVDCCNGDCGWQGLKSQALRWKHDTGDIICPECHEICEPHNW